MTTEKTLPPFISGKNAIIVRGARQHNLRDFTLAIPKHKLVVFTGPSGSGKSSLAFDTIYAEGQRRYVDSMSAYARQFLEKTEKPDVDILEGLSPTISIEQKTTSTNSRSTVGTVTEIYDHVRILWAQLGIQHCYKCGGRVRAGSKEKIIKAINEIEPGTRYMILAPIVRNRKGEFRQLLDELRENGYTRARIDGKLELLEDIEILALNYKHDIDLVVDRLVAKADNELIARLTDTVDQAISMGNGDIIVLIPRQNGVSKEREEIYSTQRTCPKCDTYFPELTHQSFSFNSVLGWCPDCHGTGVMEVINPERFVENPSLSIAEGAIVAFGPMPGERGSKSFPLKKEIAKGWEQLQKLVKSEGCELTQPWESIPRSTQLAILHGREKYLGAIREIEKLYEPERFDSLSAAAATFVNDFFDECECPKCQGLRLRVESLCVNFKGISIADVNSTEVKDLAKRLREVQLDERETRIGGDVVKEIIERLEFLDNVGLSYLTLGRSAGSLSGGEAQRIRLASQLGSGLSGVLYILDEPSIGLHQRDNDRLLRTLQMLRDRGNSVIVVEHDRETMEHADYIVDFGPGGGNLGGEMMAAGTYQDLLNAEGSITADYLSGRKRLDPPSTRRPHNGRALIVRGAYANNLKDIDVRIPQNTFTCVTGISGAGKSTLVNSIIYPAVARELYSRHRLVGEHRSIEGVELFDKVIEIDQQPIGRTPRSNPATYTKVFDEIRRLFAELPASKMYGFNAGRFSFNTAGGRCEECDGAGRKKVELGFLANTYVPCERCLGKRYNHTTLLIEYKGKNIADVLDMTVAEAADFFQHHPKIRVILQTLLDVGLDYIQLGQSSTLLSGGEAQRIKLSRELAKRATGKTLYILDEPSTGLHFDDIRKFLSVIQRLVDDGNTVLMIEHNVDIIKAADYVIDMGPEGGDSGGYIVAEGTPEEVAQNPASVTGPYLR